MSLRKILQPQQMKKNSDPEKKRLERLENLNKNKIDDKKLNEINLFLENKKIAVITALFLIDKSADEMDKVSGNYQKNPNWDYILYTNNKTLINTDFYEVREIDVSKFTHGIYANKYVKWMSHKLLPDHDVVIWIDAHIMFDNDFNDLLKQYVYNVLTTSENFYIKQHQQKTIGFDLKWCLATNRITKNIYNNVSKYLSDNKFNINTPVKSYWACCVIKNNKSPTVHKFSSEIINLINNIGFRDQHWIPFLSKKLNVSIGIINNFVFSYDSNCYNYFGHNYSHVEKNN